jgi:hypothetical protein
MLADNLPERALSILHCAVASAIHFQEDTTTTKDQHAISHDSETRLAPSYGHGAPRENDLKRPEGQNNET